MEKTDVKDERISTVKFGWLMGNDERINNLKYWDGLVIPFPFPLPSLYPRLPINLEYDSNG